MALAGVTTGAHGAQSKAAPPNGRCNATMTTTVLPWPPPRSTRWCTRRSTPARRTIPWSCRRSSSRPPPLRSCRRRRLVKTLLQLTHHLLVLLLPCLSPPPAGLLSLRRPRTSRGAVLRTMKSTSSMTYCTRGCSTWTTDGPRCRLCWSRATWTTSRVRSGRRCTSRQTVVGRWTSSSISLMSPSTVSLLVVSLSKTFFCCAGWFLFLDRCIVISFFFLR
jgi:hypothetical protein